MAATKRKSPRKAIKASQTIPVTPPSTGKSSQSSRPSRVRKPTAKARQASQRRRRSAPSSPDTLSADEVPETDLDPERDPESDRNAWDDLSSKYRKMFLEMTKANGGKQRNAHLKGYRVTENPPYKRRVSHSSEESSDLEMIDRVSFIHSEGMRPFLTLHTHYRSVEVKYFKQIFNGTFLAKNLTKLGQNVTDRGDSDAAQKPKGVAQLLQCFGVYAVAVIFFADESIRLDLTMALEEYRYRLASYSLTYKFDSLREYNHSFINVRRIEG